MSANNVRRGPNIRFSVPFVKGKERPRVTGNGAFTPQETQIAEMQIWQAYKKASLDKYGEILEAPKGVPVHVIIKVYGTMPESAPKSKGEAEPFTQKPDADNVIKAVLDALNPKRIRKGNHVYSRHGAWIDDAQVVRVICHKVERRRMVPERTDVIVIFGNGIGESHE